MMAFSVTAEMCQACGDCLAICPADGAIIEGEPYRIDDELCVECGVCVEACQTGAIYESRKLSVAERLAELNGDDV